MVAHLRINVNDNVPEKLLDGRLLRKAIVPFFHLAIDNVHLSSKLIEGKSPTKERNTHVFTQTFQDILAETQQTHRPFLRIDATAIVLIKIIPYIKKMRP